MSELRDLYQEVILDHNRSPRNFGELADATHDAEGFNPLCGDKLKLYLRIADDTVLEAQFIGSGCAISTASASLLTESIKGKSLAQTKILFHQIHAMLLDKQTDQSESLGKLEVLSGVKEYPTRIKCASLAWHTLVAALEQKTSATTE